MFGVIKHKEERAALSVVLSVYEGRRSRGRGDPWREEGG